MRSTLLLLLAHLCAAYIVPMPPGKYNVALTTGPLVDWTRFDGTAATPEPRALMLSIFQPATCASNVPMAYMPNKTAEYQGPYLQKVFNISIDLSPLFEQALLPVCPDASASDDCHVHDNQPILLFSPGYGIPRLYYNLLASAIASEGFTVITIDHPEDANIIVYPDGHDVYNLNASSPDNATLIAHEHTRAADASFLINQLANATAMGELLPHRGARAFPTDRVAMLGHSLGGAASLVAAGQDRRIRGAINWDGTVFGWVPPSGMSQPVLFMSEDAAPSSSWIDIWPRFEGPKAILTVANTTHETFTDVPSMLDAAGVGTAPFASLLGSIGSTRMVKILATTTSAWMHGAFTGGGAARVPAEGEFSEVSTTLKGNF